jgi:hypothetical protein
VPVWVPFRPFRFPIRPPRPRRVRPRAAAAGHARHPSATRLGGCAPARAPGEMRPGHLRGAGPRVGIGSGFAMLEATAILALLLSDLRFDATAAPPPARMEITLRPKSALMMFVEGCVRRGTRNVPAGTARRGRPPLVAEFRCRKELAERVLIGNGTFRCLTPGLNHREGSEHRAEFHHVRVARLPGRDQATLGGRHPGRRGPGRGRQAHPERSGRSAAAFGTGHPPHPLLGRLLRARRPRLGRGLERRVPLPLPSNHPLAELDRRLIRPGRTRTRAVQPGRAPR